MLQRSRHAKRAQVVFPARWAALGAHGDKFLRSLQRGSAALRQKRQPRGPSVGLRFRVVATLSCDAAS